MQRIASREGGKIVVGPFKKTFFDFCLTCKDELIVEAGSKIGVVGSNGAGKSILLKMLSEYQAPRTKICLVRQQDQEEQDNHDNLPLHKSPVSLIDAEKWKNPRGLLSKWKLAADTHLRPIRTLSGGEKKKLSLLVHLIQEPNILLLDEPTNHMDIESIDTMIPNLLDYEGGLVVSSHNKHFLRSVCSTFWEVRNGTVSIYDGSIDDYVAQVKEELGLTE